MIPFSVSILLKWIPVATGNLSTFTLKPLETRCQVKLGCVIIAAVNLPKAASSEMLNCVVWLIVARLCEACKGVRLMTPRGTSVPLSTHKTCPIGK